MASSRKSKKGAHGFSGMDARGLDGGCITDFRGPQGDDWLYRAVVEASVVEAAPPLV